MVNKKIKKSAGGFTLTTVAVTIIIVIALFQGTFYLIEDSVEAAGKTIDPKYQESFDRLNSSTHSLDDNINEIKDNFGEVVEAPNAAFAVWNGLKGLGNTLKLPKSFIDTSLDTFSAFTGLGIIPDWAKLLIEIALLGALVFLVLAILKGEPRT